MLTGGISGSGNLTFSGPGMLTLDAANGYTGATSITAETLAIGGSGSIASNLTYSSGASIDWELIANTAGDRFGRRHAGCWDGWRGDGAWQATTEAAVSPPCRS